MCKRLWKKTKSTIIVSFVRILYNFLEKLLWMKPISSLACCVWLAHCMVELILPWNLLKDCNSIKAISGLLSIQRLCRPCQNNSCNHFTKLLSIKVKAFLNVENIWERTTFASPSKLSNTIFLNLGFYGQKVWVHKTQRRASRMLKKHFFLKSFETL